jgi:4-hydroxy-tetrahydrodipicolinate synthase
MLYDIPGPHGVPFRPETLEALAQHPQVVAVKDAKDDLGATSWLLRETGLAVYSGTDQLNLPLLSIGGVGMVSVVSHVVTPHARRAGARLRRGDVAGRASSTCSCSRSTAACSAPRASSSPRRRSRCRARRSGPCACRSSTPPSRSARPGAGPHRRRVALA